MEQSPSWDAKSHSASQRPLMNPKMLVPCSQEPSTGPYKSQVNPIRNFSSYFSKISVEVYLSYCAWVCLKELNDITKTASMPVEIWTWDI
jgi:hypothetical protein